MKKLILSMLIAAPLSMHSGVSNSQKSTASINSTSKITSINKLVPHAKKLSVAHVGQPLSSSDQDQIKALPDDFVYTLSFKDGSEYVVFSIGFELKDGDLEIMESSTSTDDNGAISSNITFEEIPLDVLLKSIDTAVQNKSKEKSSSQQDHIRNVGNLAKQYIKNMLPTTKFHSANLVEKGKLLAAPISSKSDGSHLRNVNFRG